MPTRVDGSQRRRPGGASAKRLAELTGTAAQEIEELQSPGLCSPRFRYCFICLMVNPQDVFAPYWKRHWLDRDGAGCDVHPDALKR